MHPLTCGGERKRIALPLYYIALLTARFSASRRLSYVAAPHARVVYSILRRREMCMYNFDRYIERDPVIYSMESEKSIV